MEAARHGEHGDEDSDRAGDAEHGHDGGNPAGADASQIVNEWNCHGSDPPQGVNDAQMHGRESRQNSGDDADSDGRCYTGKDCFRLQYE